MIYYTLPKHHGFDLGLVLALRRSQQISMITKIEMVMECTPILPVPSQPYQFSINGEINLLSVPPLAWVPGRSEMCPGSMACLSSGLGLLLHSFWLFPLAQYVSFPHSNIPSFNAGLVPPAWGWGGTSERKLSWSLLFHQLGMGWGSEGCACC